MAEDERPWLHVCTTCKRRDEDGAAEGEAPAGQRLCEAVETLLDGAGPDAPVRLSPVVCLAGCERSCTAILSSPGKWAYMVGDLTPDHASDLIAYGAAYAASTNGVVLRSGRPPSLRHAIMGRFPGHLMLQPKKDAAE